MKSQSILGAFLAVAAIGAAHAASAQVAPDSAQYTESYGGSSLIPIDEIITANSYPDGSYGDTQFGATITPATYGFSDPFLKDSAIFSSKTFFFGESQDTIISSASAAVLKPSDEEPQTHLVVAMELNNSQAAIGQDFSDVFSEAPTEAAILNALDVVYSSSSDQDQQSAAESTLFDFIIAAESEGALFSTNAQGSAFNLVSFSDGIVVGNGTASVTGGSVSAAPEPANWALLLAGVGLTGAMLRNGGALVRRKEERAVHV